MVVDNEVRHDADRLPGIRDVWAAWKRIAPVVKRTPLIKSPFLSEATGCEVYLKLETLQEIGAFKIRGAANKILSLNPGEKERGVVTFSTGNHGLAVACVAGQLGIPAVICISRRVPGAKVEALRRLGASLEIHGESQDEAEQLCYRLAKERNMTVISAFDDPYVIAGQGTIGLELLADCPELDSVIVPVSGGGLISGVALTLKSNDPDTRVIGVSMEKSAVMYNSLKEGKPVALPEEDTLADSLLGGIGLDNRYTFRMVQKYVDDVRLVSEDAIAGGMAYLFKNHRLVVEGAAATGVAALLNLQLGLRPGSKVAVIISGHNVDMTTFLQVVNKQLQ